jgi:hypothetical protein
MVPADRLKKVLGIAEVQYIARHSHLALVDAALEEMS